MPYYGSGMEGDPGLFGKLFKGLKKFKFGRFVGGVARGAITGTGTVRSVLGGLGFRPSSPAKGVVAKVHEIRLQGGGTSLIPSQLARRARKRRATFRRVGTRVKAESSFARRRRLGLI